MLPKLVENTDPKWKRMKYECLTHITHTAAAFWVYKKGKEPHYGEDSGLKYTKIQWYRHKSCLLSPFPKMTDKYAFLITAHREVQ